METVQDTTVGILLCACQPEDDGIIAISFDYGLEGMGQNTPYKVRVPAIGSISDTFEDIKEKLQKVVTKVKKRQRKMNKRKTGQIPSMVSSGAREAEKQNDHIEKVELDCANKEHESEPCIHLHIKQSGQVLDHNSQNAEGWITNNILTIRICDVTVHYNIVYNPPIVTNIELSRSIFSDYLTYPKGNYINCDKKSCRFEWFKCKQKAKKVLNKNYKKLFLPEVLKTEQESQMIENCGNERCDTDIREMRLEQIEVNLQEENSQHFDIITKYEESEDWTFLGTGFTFTPTKDDVGCYLKVVCKPNHGVNHKIEYSCESRDVVRLGPNICPFERRHEHTKTRASNGSFRILSYNILADRYANTRSSIDMYYPYCPPFALNLDYRMNLVIKELLGYKADIFCLQEVDQKVFEHYLLPIFELSGYQGSMRTKSKTLSQGVSIFFKTDKFRLIGTHDQEVLSALLYNSIHEHLLHKISQNVTFKYEISQRKTILKVQVLECLDHPGKLLLVANTHLTCGQRIAHIRGVQITVALKHIENVIATQYKDRDVSVMLCGDLNSLPESAVVQILSKGEVTSKHADWFIGGRPEYVGNMDLSTSIKLESAFNNVPYTNYVSGFYGIIDYIFHDREKLEMVNKVPLPLHEEILENTACPSIKIPSDHLALICDIKWKQ